MALTCPLCLAKIDAKDLVHFCMLHDFVGDPKNPHAGCNQCRQKEVLDVGTFVSHPGCKARNPFADRFRQAADGGTAERAESPVASGDEPPDLINPDGEMLGDEGLRVSHWELSMLARAARLHADRCEMWFPYPLLQAISRPQELSEFGSRRIKLVGAREVGKTTLASLALKSESYREEGVGFSVRSFVYATPSAGGGSPAEPFLEALHLTNVFDNAQTTTQQRLKPTTIRTKSVRAAFLSIPAQSRNRPAPSSKWDLTRYVLKTAQAAQKPYAAAVIFYDFAGDFSAREN